MLYNQNHSQTPQNSAGSCTLKARCSSAWFYCFLPHCSLQLAPQSRVQLVLLKSLLIICRLLAGTSLLPEKPVVKGPYLAGQFLCDVSFLDTREAKYSFLWIRYGWHIRPSIPIKREWPVTTTLFFPNWSGCDIPCICFWEEDGWKFTFSRVVWRSSRHLELLACFFCWQHDLGIYLFMHFFWGGGGRDEKHCQILSALNLTKMNKYIYVCICIYQISLYISNICVHKIIVPLPFIDIIALPPPQYNYCGVYPSTYILLGLFFSLSDFL